MKLERTVTSTLSDAEIHEIRSEVVSKFELEDKDAKQVDVVYPLAGTSPFI